jgi:uracil-DNA glycosylase
LRSLIANTHVSWHAILEQALAKVEPAYLEELFSISDWLPGSENFLNAFSLPLENTRYLLLGESPYPRAASANGYAFWDAAVGSLWSETGFSKQVNRATSLRNWIKMMLVVRGDLEETNVSQTAIAALDNSIYTQTAAELFGHFLDQGFLLLNASLVFRGAERVKADAQAWVPFLETLLELLKGRDIELVLFGNIANKINKLDIVTSFKTLSSEHPYNISFIHNKTVQDFFRPLDLLQRRA